MKFALGTDTLLVYGELHDGKYERHLVLERPTSVPIARPPGVTLDLTSVFAP